MVTCLLVIIVLLGFVNLPINKFIISNNIGYKDQDSSTYNVNGISYNVPNKWRTIESDKGYYHYPYIENSDGLLYVYSENFGNTKDYDNLEECYKSFIEGFKDSDDNEYFKMISEEPYKILDKEGYKLKCKRIMGGVYFDVEMYFYLDTDTNTLYVFMFGIKDSIPSDISKNIKEIISSIKER